MMGRCLTLVLLSAVVMHITAGEYTRDHLGYVRNPHSLMEGTETLCRDDIGDLLGSPDHL